MLQRIFPPLVSIHSRPKAAEIRRLCKGRSKRFQYTAARRRLSCGFVLIGVIMAFQYTAARRRLLAKRFLNYEDKVSIHSRPKAAVQIKKRVGFLIQFQYTAARRRLQRQRRQMERYPCFNTQPPEGGWCRTSRPQPADRRFNTQPPEGGCPSCSRCCRPRPAFQYTAARRRLLRCKFDMAAKGEVSIHSRPKAAEPLSKALLHQVSQP